MDELKLVFDAHGELWVAVAEDVDMVPQKSGVFVYHMKELIIAANEVCTSTESEGRCARVRHRVIPMRFTPQPPCD